MDLAEMPIGFVDAFGIHFTLFRLRRDGRSERKFKKLRIDDRKLVSHARRFHQAPGVMLISARHGLHDADLQSPGSEEYRDAAGDDGFAYARVGTRNKNAF